MSFLSSNIYYVSKFEIAGHGLFDGLLNSEIIKSYKCEWRSSGIKSTDSWNQPDVSLDYNSATYLLSIMFWLYSWFGPSGILSLVL